MLVFSRKLRDIVIDGDIVITVVRIDRNQVRIGIEAPGSVPIHRSELLVAASIDETSPSPTKLEVAARQSFLHCLSSLKTASGRRQDRPLDFRSDANRVLSSLGTLKRIAASMNMEKTGHQPARFASKGVGVAACPMLWVFRASAPRSRTRRTRKSCPMDLWVDRRGRDDPHLGHLAESRSDRLFSLFLC